VTSPSEATKIVEFFFDAYRQQDVDRMVELCDENAGYRSVPFETWRKQRIVRGNGKVCTVGKPLWSGLIEAFPDLTNRVVNIISGEDGHVAAEVMICGTQAKDWVPVHTRGRHYRSPHLFLIRVGESGKIENITSYSDNAGVRQQLGCMEVD
jgi:ketosteroid isomerase-like protein